MSDSTTKPLNQFSLAILGAILAAGEWYDNPGQLYRAGQIIEEVLPDIEPEPTAPTDRPSTADDRAAHKAWAAKPAPWKREPTPKEVEVMKACVRKFADKKALRGSIHILPLLNLAALKPED